MPVKVVTDSTADLPPALAKELGITVVPLNVPLAQRCTGTAWRSSLTNSTETGKQPSPSNHVPPTVGTFCGRTRS